jgi:N-acetyl-anhydromuramyl-L-alanine amidase AmpD
MGSIRLARYYPTPKRRGRALVGERPLWWTLHSTSGVSIRPVVVWFSGEPRPGKDGRVRLRGGSTHYAIEHDGTPWCFIRPEDGAWHCRQRNRDSLSVELVNACGLTHHVDDGGEFYRWWAGRYELPYEPVHLGKVWRGREYWQPYDERQLVALVKLMRLAMEAVGRERFSDQRVAQHSQWNQRKTDCGPLFPEEAVTLAAFSQDPISAVGWVQAFTQEQHPSWDANDTVGTGELERLLGHAVDLDEREGADPEDEDADPADTMRLVQSMLAELGHYKGKIDSKFGPLTRAATIAFQEQWNKDNPGDQIAKDGIPGPITMERLRRKGF